MQVDNIVVSQVQRTARRLSTVLPEKTWRQHPSRELVMYLDVVPESFQSINCACTGTCLNPRLTGRKTRLETHIEEGRLLIAIICFFRMWQS